MNEIIVAKFGGSSLADSEQFKKVKSIVMEDSRRKYIVPSAPGKRFKEDYKITDLLYLCHAHVEQNISFEEVFNIIEERYMGLVEELNLDLDIKSELNIVREKVKNGASKDYTASRGEYLNGLILAAYLNIPFVDPKELIYFNEKGLLDLEVTFKRVSEKLSGTPTAVIPGFYGALENGDIKTFSRGGSDITGSIISRGVNAALYENWTDVSGFLMADPRIVDNPRNIEKITYKELRELSYMGATVLHEEAVFPVREAGIPINIKNTNKPEDKGTLIVSDDNFENTYNTITGVAGKKDFTVITIEKTMMNAEKGYCRRVLSILEDHNMAFEHMPSGIDNVSVIVSNSELNGKLEEILEEIRFKCKPDFIEVHGDMALIAVVGKVMKRNAGISAKLFNALYESDVNVRMITQGSSEINIIIGVENGDFEKALKVIYEAF